MPQVPVFLHLLQQFQVLGDKMAEIKIEKKLGQVSQAWRSAGSDAMPQFRLSAPRDERAAIIARTTGNVLGAVDKVVALGRKLQDDADDMELVQLENKNREMMDTIARDHVFYNEGDVNSAAETHRKTLSDWISENKVLSARGKKRANMMLEKMNGIYKSSANNKYLNFLANHNISIAKENLEKAQHAGDFAKAKEWLGTLDSHMVRWNGRTSGISEADINSKTAVAAYLNKTRDYGISALREDLKNLDKRNEDGTMNLLGMKINPQDAEYLTRTIRQKISRQINSGADLLDELYVQGELTHDKLAELYRGGVISAAQYTQRQNFLDREEQQNIIRKYNAGAETVNKLIAENSFTREKLEELYRDGAISADMYIKQRNFFERQEQTRTLNRGKEQYLDILETLYNYDATGKSNDDIVSFQSDMNEALAASDINREQQMHLRSIMQKMFRVSSVEKKVKVENPWSSQRGQELKKLIESRFNEGGYAYKKDKTPVVAVDRKLQMLTAGARLLMDNNGTMQVSEIMERLDHINELMKEGELKRILNGRGGVIDPDKFGKVFDSREMKDQVFVGLFGPKVLKAKSKIEHLKKEGYIDKADIVKDLEKDGRLVWVLKDGKEVYADEYE
jgi:hypothetical protein